MNNYEALFSPFKVSNTEIKNRFVMCAMGGVYIYSLDGKPVDETYDYYI